MYKTPVKVLLLEDNPADVVFLQVTLERDPHTTYHLTVEKYLSRALQHTHASEFDIVLLDLGLPDSQGLETFQQFQAANAQLPVIVLSGLMDEELAVQAVRLGAQDYIVKGNTGWDSLSRSIRHAIERKQTQKALTESETRYRTLFENSPVAIWEEDFTQVKMHLSALQQGGVTDLYTYFTEHTEALLECIRLIQVKDVNRAAMAMYKVADKAELLGSLENTLPPESLVSFKAELLTIAQNKTSFASESAIRTTSGELRYVTVNWVTAPGHEESYDRVLVSLIDITDRRQAELKYREIFENSLEGIFQSTPDGRFISVNPAMARIYGYASPQEMMHSIGSDIAGAMYLDPKDRDQFTQLFQQSDVIEDLKMKNRRKDGSVIWSSTSARAVRNAEGKIIYYEGFLQDITQRKQVEEQLQASEARYRLATLATQDIIWEWNSATGQLKWADNVQLVLGYSPEEIGPYDTWWDEHIHPEDRQRVLSSLEPITLKSGSASAWTDEYRFRRKNGSYAWINDHAYIERDSSGKVIRMIGAMSDITEHKQAEEELKKRDALLAEAQRIGHIGHIEWDLPSQTLTCSDEIYEILEIPYGSAVTQQTIAALATPAERARLHDIDLQAFAAQKDLDYEFYIQLSGGRIRWLHQRAAITYGEDGRPVRVIGTLQDITAHKQAEEAIRNSENRFRALIENGLDYISLLDQQGNLLWESPSSTSLLGFKFNEFIGRNIFELVHPDDRTWTFREFSDLANQPGQRITGIFRLRRNDGAWRWVEAVASNFLKDPSVQAIIINYRDITERKQAEEAIRRSQSLLAQAGTMAHLGAWEIDVRDPENLYANPVNWSDEVYRILGYIPGTVTPTNDLFFERVHPTERAQVQQAMIQAVREHQAYAVEHRIIQPNGLERIIEEHANLIYDKQGRLIQVLGAVQDITERKQAEDSLKQTSEQFRILFEASPEAILLIDPSGEWPIVDCNHSACEINGYSREELIGQPIDLLNPAPGGDEAGRLAYLESVRAAGILRFEDVHRRKDGTLVPIETSTSVIQVGDRELLLGIDRDITERKNAEQALRDSEALYRQAIEVADGVPYRETYFNNGLSIHYDFIGAGIREITGYGPEEFNSDLWDSLTEEAHLIEDLEGYSVDEGMRRVRAGDNPIWKCEYRIRAKDGKIHWVLEAAVELRDEAGISHGSIGMYQDITARKQAEEALRISAEENQAIINAVPDLLFRIDQHGQIVGYHARDNVELYVGPEAFLGKSILEVLPANISEAGMAALHKASLTGEMTTFEYELTMHGLPRFYENRMVPLSNQEVLSIIRDETDRKQVELALRQSETRYRGIFEGVQDAILVESPEGDILEVNQRACDMYGYTHAEFLKLKVANLVPHEKYIVSLTEDGLSAPLYQTIETLNVRANGEQFPVEIRGGLYDFGERRAFLIVLRDITERKQVEQALRDSEERYRRLISQLPVVVYTDEVVAGIGVTQYVSPQIESILGFSPEEWLAGGFEGWKKQIHAEDRERVVHEYLSCLSSGIPFECEYRLHTKSGNLIWVLDQFRVSQATQGQLTYSHGILYDITERKQAEEENQRRLAELEALYENGLAISRLLDPRLISEKVVEVLSVKLQWHHAAIRLFHHERNQLELVALNHPGLSEDQLREQVKRLSHLIADPTRGLTGWAVMHRTTVRSGELLSDLRYVETYPGMHSGLYVPILAGKRVLGVISVESELANAFTEQDERLLLTLANQAAVAIENAQLYIMVQNELDERQQMEARLRESEARQNGIIEAAMDAIITVDESQHIVLFNAAAERTFGCPVDEALGQPIERFIPERFRAQHYHHVQQFGESDITTRNMRPESEGVGLRSNGTEFPLEASISQITVAGAKLYTVILRDITERKNAEAELRQSEENYRLLFELSPEGIISHDGRQVTFANAAAAKLVGASDTLEIIGRSVLDFVHPDYHQLAIERIQKQARSERILPAEEKFIRLDGSLVDVEVNAAPIRTQGKPAFLVTIRDITERKRAEEALRQSEEQYRHLAEELEQRVLERTSEVQDLYNNAPCGYHSLDEQGRLMRINETELKWLGYSRAELLNHSFTEFMTSESQTLFSKSFVEFRTKGDIKDLEFDLIRKDGSIMPVLISATAIYDSAGKYLTSRSTLFDNTERRFALETLRLANAEMKRALRTKDEFLANMSHELRTPLNAILGLSESLLEQTAGDLNEKQQKYLTTINESGTHLLALINDILDLAKVEAGQIKLDPGKVDINNVCQASLRMIKQLAQKKNLTVEVNIEKNIGYIWADERRLKQMLVNLLSNAVKFTPAGNKLGLNAQIDFKESKLMLTIWDNGIGIRDEDLPRLFKPFVQLDSSLSREISGTGLGLALVAQMARLHGGSISVSSVPGQGSRFTIVLPWDPAITTETLEKFKVTGRFPSLKSLPGKPKTILLVEDTDSVVMMVQDYLELSGYKVELARDGVSGVAKAFALQPDLILMDVQMPGMDGFEATRRIRLEMGLQNVPIIALTALAMTNDRERCLEAGMNDYISKPINLRQLVKTIQGYLANTPAGGDA